MMTKLEPTEDRAAIESDAAPAALRSVKKASPQARKVAHRGTIHKASRKTAKATHQAAAAGGRAGTKGGKILELIKRPSGATLAQLGKASGWQPHSIRGFLSTAAKKHRVKITSSANGGGQRIYRAAK